MTGPAREPVAEDPWQLAHDAAAHAGVVLRPLTALQDAAAIERVMIATWGEHQLLPAEVIRALGESGNVPYGAADGDELIGYVLGWAGVDPVDGLHLHSHMLAAMPDRRHRGVGYALKLAQRAQCLEQGIRLVRWTFDPLISRNAWFNLVKLGAIADRFLPNFYGDMSDEINRGDRSDRLVVRWDLGAMTPGARKTDGTVVLDREENTAGPPRPTDVRRADTGAAVVRIPRQYHDLRATDPTLGDAWRRATAAAFSQSFDDGYVVSGFTDDSSYVLTRASAL
jgi:predicted GNAT superfamily acetyltransferase